MAVPGEGAAVLELEIALRPFQGLDVRLLVDREYESALGRIKIEADDLRGLGDEIGIVALAEDFLPSRSIFWARRKRQTYWSLTSPRASATSPPVQRA